MKSGRSSNKTGIIHNKSVEIDWDLVNYRRPIKWCASTLYDLILLRYTSPQCFTCTSKGNRYSTLIHQNWPYGLQPMNCSHKIPGMRKSSRSRMFPGNLCRSIRYWAGNVLRNWIDRNSFGNLGYIWITLSMRYAWRPGYTKTR